MIKIGNKLRSYYDFLEDDVDEQQPSASRMSAPAAKGSSEMASTNPPAAANGSNGTSDAPPPAMPTRRASVDKRRVLFQISEDSTMDESPPLTPNNSGEISDGVFSSGPAVTDNGANGTNGGMQKSKKFGRYVPLS